jgi:hypothetical protein
MGHGTSISFSPLTSCKNYSSDYIRVKGATEELKNMGAFAPLHLIPNLFTRSSAISPRK